MQLGGGRSLRTAVTALALLLALTAAVLAQGGTNPSSPAPPPPGKPAPPPSTPAKPATPPTGKPDVPTPPPAGQVAPPAATPPQTPHPDAPSSTAPGGAEAPLAITLTPPAPPVILPEPVSVEVIDVPNDDGTGVGVLWRWGGEPADTLLAAIQVQADASWLNAYKLTDTEDKQLKAAADQYKAKLAPLQPQYDAAQKTLGDAQAALQIAVANKSADAKQLNLAVWQAQQKFDALDKQKGKLDDWLHQRIGKLGEKQLRFEYLQAALTGDGWLDTNVKGPAAKLGTTKGDKPARFGTNPPDKDKLYQEVNAVVLPAPAGAKLGELNDYAQTYAKTVTIPFDIGKTYKLRMALKDGDQSTMHDLGSPTAKRNAIISTKLNNLIFAVCFSIIILVAIAWARKNPNLFIRRIAGLEAVDEAIGRATEMGKPVLYLNGMTTLADLSTLAAVNILGRVARRVAEYDSALLVPCRDPVVLSVAQEVVREGFIDQGRPDAFREDNIYFVTDDQFAYTASVCATMLREKPAAVFLMGYYYAESLLLAETGASVGAIQIAGTDSQSQLPFFITACDYTLIGEELYAASAYLSREPLLLGSLKGQDVGKALIMLLILVQTILFVINPHWDWLKRLVTPL